MSLMRKALLAGSQNKWLRDRAMRARFVRRAVSRFMPGETAADALDACAALSGQGITSIVTHLGENLASLADAEPVAQEYRQLLAAIAERSLPTQISVKPTQLGLDHDPQACLGHLAALAEEAERAGNALWIDMESSAYVDATLDLYERLREKHARTGLCLQAYLHRTPKDLERLLPLRPMIRLVKGAYLEPADVAMPDKRAVDEQFFQLAVRLLGSECFAGVATHDPRLVARLEAWIAAEGVPSERYEYEMLYGIQRGEQRRLSSEGKPLRVLISYGASWFPWYMRRLAERPANLWFVAKNMFT